MDDKGLAVAPDHEEFRALDLADEEQILAEIGGRVMEKYIYSFSSGGQAVEALSYAGVNWACREYAKRGEIIRIIGKPEIVLDPSSPEHVIACVTAQRFAIHPETGREVPLDSAVGVKRQWSKEKRRDGSVVPDPFYIEKAVSKAVRNAKTALLPGEFVKEVIKVVRDGAKKKPDGAGKRPPPAEKSAIPEPKSPAAPPLKAPAKAASPSKYENPPDKMTELRQKLYITIKKILPEDAEARKALQETHLVDSSKDLSEERLAFALKWFTACLLGGSAELRKDVNGKYEIMDRATGERILPVYPSQPNEPEPALPEEEPF